MLCQNILRLTQQIGSFFLFEMHCALSSCDFFFHSVLLFTAASSCGIGCFQFISRYLQYLISSTFSIFCLFCPNQVTEKNLWTLHLLPPPKRQKKEKRQMHWPQLTQVFSTRLKKSFKDLVASKIHLFSVAIPTLKTYFPTHFGSLHVLDFCRKYAGSVDVRS